MVDIKKPPRCEIFIYDGLEHIIVTALDQFPDSGIEGLAHRVAPIVDADSGLTVEKVGSMVQAAVTRPGGNLARIATGLNAKAGIVVSSGNVPRLNALYTVREAGVPVEYYGEIRDTLYEAILESYGLNPKQVIRSIMNNHHLPTQNEMTLVS